LAADIRSRAEEILKEVPDYGKQINSDGPTAALFTKLTGVNQQTLTDNWTKGGIRTCCMDFVGWFASRLGSAKYLGRFDLESFLPSIGKGYAWIKSTADVRPLYGDICRHTAYHVGVSLDFDGDHWNHVDAGQGGPKVGHDVLKRTRGTLAYDYRKLQGWIDLEFYFNSDPVPDWLPGWWKVMWRGQPYYYNFDKNNRVKWTRIVPLNATQPSNDFDDTGVVVFERPGAVTVRWNDTGSLEQFNKSDSDNSSMAGTWNNTEPLSATSL